MSNDLGAESKDLHSYNPAGYHGTMPLIARITITSFKRGSKTTAILL